MNIKTIVNEKVRGCGYRKAGGLYLVCDPDFFFCKRLPFPLKVCPCCSQGIKPARGWTWLNSKEFTKEFFINGSLCKVCKRYNFSCIFQNSSKVGLIWVGESFYKSSFDFMREALEQGISRRINTIPQGFKLKETVVWLAHRKAIENPCNCNRGITEKGVCSVCDGKGTFHSAGVFTAFKPQKIEYIVKNNDTNEELESKEKRGISLITLVRKGENKNE